MTVRIYIASSVTFTGRRYRSRSVTAPIDFDFETMVHGLQRIAYSGGDMSVSMVKALAFIPLSDRIHIPRSDKGWVNEELCWVNAPISMNRKGRDAHVLAAFVDSGELEWIVKEAV
ncbi:hypothetical protein [Paraburkholderia sp. BCC1885]|uniref:hypothetical protein n=1 Tax=Paraburkholderia sp. BCC1885 TaxID=2562669 RepID=UPI0011837854|nr:hypothetical protein [Paraburkholderia sp. BCC1885]